MKHLLCLVACTMMAAIVVRGEGCQNKMPADAADALASTREVTLFSLDPFVETPHKLAFHSIAELGKVRLDDAEGKAATADLRQAIDASDGTVAACSSPGTACAW